MLDWFFEEKNNHSYGISLSEQVLKPMCLKIIHVKKIGEQPVCDIEVEETHSFVANGVVAHNCMISHGAPMFVREKLFDNSDKFHVYICKNCCNITTSQNQCTLCDYENSQNVRKCYLPYIAR